MEDAQTKIEIIEYYKSLLESEITNHTNMIYILLFVATLLVGVTWWWNKKGAEKYIEKYILNHFKTQEKKLKKSIYKSLEITIINRFDDMERKILELKGDIYRSMMFSVGKAGIHPTAIYWGSQSIKCFLKLDPRP